MTIYIFGNPDLAADALPVKLMPRLKKIFPTINFKHVDPHEEWAVPNKLWIIDTVVGLKTVRLFHDLNIFQKSPRVSLHDFDAYANLLLLQKLNKLKSCAIIGVPPKINAQLALNKITALIRANLL